ncbi:MAG TPA: LysR family transcriptional regulator [Chloroflexus aurantiacus]|jgi:DNA-binding transcriptional LysR family regulator|uniref:LysR substrate-binding n=1 Tax=Chloroflexus aurantiacus (strain ATCC 29366 / DSM 635 / J-10-fl) TaxID=324602 RepID=A9WIA6_CHLAA|nr:LysR family transcriptional regulator [Chloroflexus sp.]ABY36398.1 LysR substrate-binding [Chloroflexus aurantiacus J-10-fl]RMG48567.1 MAG: LysR family transcriptional regulator [Chloroflexota bacterium]HBW67879.1 LysR family transcriptional regulator [Chloroflexus aurantiacus]
MVYIASEIKLLGGKVTLNLHLLRIYVAVLEQGSFTKAAEVLTMSQSAVSRAVQELERQLGTTLLERRARGVAPTMAGTILGEHARRIFTHERLAIEALNELRGLQRGRLAIGASSTIGIYLLPPLLGNYHRRYPGIELFLDIGNTQQIIERLLSYQIDVAYVEGPVAANEDLQVVPWRSDEMVVIASPDHPLTRRVTLDCSDLQDAPFIMREPGSGTRKVMEQALAAHNVTVRPVMELGSTEAVKQAVSAGLGLSMVSRFTIQSELIAGKLRVLNIPGLNIQRQLSRVRLHDRPQSLALEAWFKNRG